MSLSNGARHAATRPPTPRGTTAQRQPECERTILKKITNMLQVGAELHAMNNCKLRPMPSTAAAPHSWHWQLLGKQVQLLALVLALPLATAALELASADARRVNAPLIPNALHPLRWGSVQPAGWLRDWALAARHGAASPERAAFHSVRPYPHGAADGLAGQPGCVGSSNGLLCQTADGWRDGRPASDFFWDEDSAYWIDGMTRLGHVLDDSTLQSRTSDDISAVLRHPVYFHNTWIDTHDLGPPGHEAEGWVRSVYSRAMLAHYDATGDASVLHFLETVFKNYTAADSLSDRSLTQVEALFEGHAYGGPASMRDTALGIIDVNPFSRFVLNVLLSGCTSNASLVSEGKCWTPIQHGVSFNEICKVFAMAYSWSGNKTLLQASINAFQMLADFDTQVHGVISADEPINGISPNLGTETCDVSDFSYSAQWMLRITGAAEYADRIERAVFNAGPGAVNRTFLGHLYYQSPNLIASSPGIAWYSGAGNETPCHADGADQNCKYSRWTFGHYHLPPCCTGNQARMLPNFIHHASFGTYSDKVAGVAIASLVPSRVHVAVGGSPGHSALIEVLTSYPFEEGVLVNITQLDVPTSFPLKLLVPSWCDEECTFAINGEPPVSLLPRSSAGWLTITRIWKLGDTVSLHLRMPVRATVRYTFDGGAIPTFDRDAPWKGQNVTAGLPFCVVEAGPLTFALPLEDSEGLGPSNFALDCNASKMTLARPKSRRVGTGGVFDWPLAAPVTIEVEAQAFDWPDVWRLPDHAVPRSQVEPHRLMLVPYGCAKQFHISMFPVLSNSSAV